MRLSGKKLERPKKNADSKAEEKNAYQDNTDRIEVERNFSLVKRKFGLGVYADPRTTPAREFDRASPDFEGSPAKSRITPPL